MKTTTINISGMTCMGCTNSIRIVLERINGVSVADISLEKNQAKIQYDPEKTTINKFEEAIIKAGFEINT
ncbi:MAG: heavy metal transporter [Nitrosomonadaceae bacterium]|nr:heavy metal transporter [Nitrosomonadaceae bacterium]|tara:strand:- start:1502 stop:1711 length:210 start_codon:yes stop_codon:yes gene_type:complete